MKPGNVAKLLIDWKVAPRVGAWIETPNEAAMTAKTTCRPPCGGVD